MTTSITVSCLDVLVCAQVRAYLNPHEVANNNVGRRTQLAIGNAISEASNSVRIESDIGCSNSKGQEVVERII